MKYAIFSDIHSNLESFDTMLKFCSTLQINFYLCCGDIVGYGPNPNECVENIKSLTNAYILCGNHDVAVIGKKDIEWFNPYAKQAILWTKTVVTQENLQYLATLIPMYKFNDNITLVHGSPREPVDEYIISYLECLDNIDKFFTKICFIGHTHIPFIFEYISCVNEISVTPQVRFIKVVVKKESFVYELNPLAKYIINVGSVGQPRDGDPRCCFTVYDEKNNKISFYRLEYDIKKTQKKMMKYNLPIMLIQRLSFGR